MLKGLRNTALAIVASAGLWAGGASAAPIDVGQLYGFGFEGPGQPLIGGAGFVMPTNPVGIEAPDGPWTFTLASAGTLTILDLFLSVDQFEIFNFGAFLGQTSAPIDGGTCDSDFTCALGDARYSRGVFALAAGDYSITGAQLQGQGGAGAMIVELDAPVPLPAALPLLASAIFGLGFMGWRRRGSVSA